MRRGTFWVWQSFSDDKWYWKLVSSTGYTLARSDDYDTRAEAVAGIREVRLNAPIARIDNVFYQTRY